MPSKLLGRVRGFHIPARKAFTLPDSTISFAVIITCSSFSALQGPEIIYGFPLTGNHFFGFIGSLGLIDLFRETKVQFHSKL
jgi:hypothetical protein